MLIIVATIGALQFGMTRRPPAWANSIDFVTQPATAGLPGEFPAGLPLTIVVEGAPPQATLSWSTPLLGTGERINDRTVRYRAERIGSEKLEVTIAFAGATERRTFEFRVGPPLRAKWRWLTPPADSKFDVPLTTQIQALEYRFPKGELLLTNPYSIPVRLESFDFLRDQFEIDRRPQLFFQIMPLLDTVIVTATNAGWGPYENGQLDLYTEIRPGAPLSRTATPRFRRHLRRPRRPVANHRHTMTGPPTRQPRTNRSTLAMQQISHFSS